MEFLKTDWIISGLKKDSTAEGGDISLTVFDTLFRVKQRFYLALLQADHMGSYSL
jgi:hypothetical protein